MTMSKTLALAAVLSMTAAPAVWAQAATTLGGGGATRANGGAAGGSAGAGSMGAGSTGAGIAGTGVGGNAGAGAGEVGSRASSAAKGNDPTGTNGATNNRY